MKQPTDPPLRGSPTQIRGLYDQVAAEFAAEVDRLAELATRSLGSPGEGLAAMELAIRTAMTQLGASLLGRLLAADTGHRGPRIDCGAGHCTGFVGYRSKTIQTVLGSVELRRAYYHCRVCRRGVVPRDDELGVTGVSLSPGLRRITARAAAAVPFATAADLLAELAGIQLPAKRIERSAEADGAATARRLAAESTAIVRPSVSMLPPVPMPDKLYVAVDGTGVPVVAAGSTIRSRRSSRPR